MKYIVFFIIIFTSFQTWAQSRKTFEIGPLVNYSIHPGVTLFPEQGPVIMKSRVAASFMYGLGMQFNSSDNRFASCFDAVFGYEPNLRTLTVNWDYLGALTRNVNSISESLYKYAYKSFQLNFDYCLKYYFSPKPSTPFLLTGVRLIAGFGLQDGHDLYYEIINNNGYDQGVLIENSQDHTTMLRHGLLLGYGYRKEIKYFTLDFKTRLFLYKPHYWGEYETGPTAPFYAKGSYIQKGYIIELGLSVYFRTFKN